MSSNRQVILGVGGGIAAYKACDLLRRLQERGFDVFVIPTPASLNFVGKATWEALSGNPVTTQVWEEIPSVRHVSLGSANIPILIAPATADLIARIAAGRADDLLSTTVLATEAPVFLAPAMHPAMWKNQATQDNCEILEMRGFGFIEPAEGRLTGEDSGIGRLPETIDIINAFENFLGQSLDLKDKRVLISAGGTREPIDAVRFIGNKSSGKQGYALAKIAAQRGAHVDLVLANAHFSPFPGVTFHHVSTAEELLATMEPLALTADIVIASAAVADAKPLHTSEKKIHKENLKSINLVENPDVIATLAIAKKPHQIFVGFAAETENHSASAWEKMERKGLDVIYVNDVSGGAIFGSDSTYGTILTRDGAQISVGESSKEELAELLLNVVREKLG